MFNNNGLRPLKLLEYNQVDRRGGREIFYYHSNKLHQHSEPKTYAYYVYNICTRRVYTTIIILFDKYNKLHRFFRDWIVLGVIIFFFFLGRNVNQVRICRCIL